MLKRGLKVAGIIVVVLLVAAFGYRRWMVWDRTRDVLPSFTEVPDGPRAPSSTFVGLTIGKSTLPEVEAWTRLHGFTCRDTSMRALMQLGREQAQAKMEEAKASGTDPDTVSGASRANYYSKKEQNPRVFLACEKASMTGLDALDRAGSQAATGTVLLSFDSKNHPLRYVMVERKLFLQVDVLAQFKAVTEQFTAQLGAPTSASGRRPLEDDNPDTRIFDRMQLVSNEWKFADRRAEIVVFNFGLPKGISVRETFEVPWPVRTDGLGFLKD
ncbi:MAG: hypothetical protein Q8O67_07105 [Deltaproteobacteria bacterium]|nr:hypothetical protein [Deltaproteobacteria bacterium]